MILWLGLYIVFCLLLFLLRALQWNVQLSLIFIEEMDESLDLDLSWITEQESMLEHSQHIELNNRNR
jgi:hypothetical protein